MDKVDRTTVEQVFDSVTQTPESSRGYDVPETCRLLAESVKQRFPRELYETVLRMLETIYLERFVHTMIIDPELSRKIKSGTALYL